MENPLIFAALIMTLLPLIGSIIAGLCGKLLGRKLTHRLVIICIAAAFVIACYLFNILVLQGHAPVDQAIYTWASSESLKFQVAFLLDPLSAIMLVVVLFVSLMVHIYTIGYMADDAGYTRFFSYVSLFTFAMLMLVLGDNFLQLFFGWEAVGLVSYLLIGFWFTKDAAAAGSLKAFLVNRISDIGFLIGIAAVLMHFGTLNYQEIFPQVANVANQTVHVLGHYRAPVIGFICFCLFIGAMGKSAQVPMHVWLPESMEGPTPISALIHAATMVTAGIYMVARMSPLFEMSPGMLNFILIIGGTTAFFMGLLAIVQFDIKRVIAYSTISQLGYMAVALGASAYNAAIFHLLTHAFFKALLFLAAGSVIIAMHHEQDMRKMGGLAAYLPVTYLTFAIGALALSAVPPFAGFYSKDLIIEAVHFSQLPAAHYAYYCVLAGAFLTPLYTFRALFMTFHTSERMDEHTRNHIHESSWVVLLPLILLAIPSIIIGQMLINPLIYSANAWLAKSLFVLPQHNAMAELAAHYHGAKLMALEAGKTLTFWLTIAGIFTAWLFTCAVPQWGQILKHRFAWIYSILLRKYGFDDFNRIVIVDGSKNLGHLLYETSDIKLIDNIFVNGSGRIIRWVAQTVRKTQTGYLYHYALSMLLGLIVFLVWYMGVIK